MVTYSTSVRHTLGSDDSTTLGDDACSGQMPQVAAIYVTVVETCIVPLCGTPRGRASVPSLKVDAPSGQTRQVAAFA